MAILINICFNQNYLATFWRTFVKIRLFFQYLVTLGLTKVVALLEVTTFVTDLQPLPNQILIFSTCIPETQEEDRAVTEVTLEILSELATGNEGVTSKARSDESNDRMLMPPPKFGLDMAGLGLKDTIQVSRVLIVLFKQ